MCKKVTILKYCSGKVFRIFSPIKYPLKRAVGQHCYGKTFSGPTSISQESRLSLGLAELCASSFTKALLSPKLSEIHVTETEKYVRKNLRYTVCTVWVWVSWVWVLVGPDFEKCLSPQTVTTLSHLASCPWIDFDNSSKLQQPLPSHKVQLWLI